MPWCCGQADADWWMPVAANEEQRATSMPAGALLSVEPICPHLGKFIAKKTKKEYKSGPGLSVYPYTQEAEAGKSPRTTQSAACSSRG